MQMETFQIITKTLNPGEDTNYDYALITVDNILLQTIINRYNLTTKIGDKDSAFAEIRYNSDEDLEFFGWYERLSDLLPNAQECLDDGEVVTRTILKLDMAGPWKDPISIPKEHIGHVELLYLTVCSPGIYWSGCISDGTWVETSPIISIDFFKKLNSPRKRGKNS